MVGHPEVLQNPPITAYPSRLLYHKQLACINSLESTLPQVLILNNLNSSRINTYAKTQGRGPHLFPLSNPKFTRKETPKDSDRRLAPNFGGAELRSATF